VGEDSKPQVTDTHPAYLRPSSARSSRVSGRIISLMTAKLTHGKRLVAALTESLPEKPEIHHRGDDHAR